MVWQLIAVMVVAFLTYVYTICKGGFVIDDDVGILEYKGKLEGKGYYYFLKYLWWLMAEKIPHRHHFFSVFLHSICCGLLYSFLIPICGTDISFLATLLFAVHPVGTQAVAWVSGKGYPLGLIGLLIALQIPSIFSYYPFLKTVTWLKYPVYAGMFAWGIMGQFAIMFTTPVNLLMGQYAFAGISFIIALLMGMDIIRKTIKGRADVFKSQSMGQSTYLKPSKFIVAMKSLAYYTALCIFPYRMGIYHIWGYHYDEKMEKEDTLFWLGVLLLTAFVVLFYYGNPIVKLGVLWYLSYIFIFLNWITIHQFVSERYCYIANIGLCIIIANYLVSFPIVASFVVALYLMRTWLHLPTYNDMVRFYLSNIWNFPKSEVAMANLGVVLVRQGFMGMALDYWSIGAKINPNYDVPFYNLYSTLKSRGDYKSARNYLVKAISAPICHFKDDWTKELENFDKEVIRARKGIPRELFPDELLNAHLLVVRDESGKVLKEIVVGKTDPKTGKK